MRVAVVTARAPFEHDPVDVLGERLASELTGHGHAATVLRFPFVESRAVLEQALALRLFVVAHVDRVVTLGFPVCHVRHDEKVVWLVESDRGHAADPPDAVPEREREAVAALLHRATREALAGAIRLFTPSEAAATVVHADYGLASEVLQPPPPTGEASWHHVIERLTA